MQFKFSSGSGGSVLLQSFWQVTAPPPCCYTQLQGCLGHAAASTFVTIRRFITNTLLEYLIKCNRCMCKLAEAINMKNHKRRYCQEIHHSNHTFKEAWQPQQYDLYSMISIVFPIKKIVDICQMKTMDRHVSTTVFPWQQKNYNLWTMSEGYLSNICLKHFKISETLSLSMCQRNIFRATEWYWVKLIFRNLGWKYPSCYDPFKDRGVKNGNIVTTTRQK